MTRDLFRRYVWLVETVKKGKKLTFDEISRMWDRSAFNVDRSPLALRTFHNHREAIELLFGIRILCDRRDHQYYIPEETAQPTNLKLWMLQTLAFRHLAEIEADDVKDRFLLDEVPEHMFGLITMIEAMKRNRLLRFNYAYEDAYGSHKRLVAPYCIRFYNHEWYLIGKEMDNETIEAYNLPLISDFKMTETKFKMPEDFNPSDYFRKFIGNEINDKGEMETIEIKARGRALDRLKALPLHGSQEIVTEDEDEAVFRIEAVPTTDLIDQLLTMQTEAEVLQPASLREEMKNRLQRMLENYQQDMSE